MRGGVVEPPRLGVTEPDPAGRQVEPCGDQAKGLHQRLGDIDGIIQGAREGGEQADVSRPIVGEG